MRYCRSTIHIGQMHKKGMKDKASSVIVERSHREDQKRFYGHHSFYSLDDFSKQLAVHNRRSNNFPMRPLGWLSPLEFSVQYV